MILQTWPLSFAYVHRPFSLVAVAGGHSDVKVWDFRLCPGYVLLDF